jgi:hypothetical protein
MVATNLTRPLLEATGSGQFEADTLTMFGDVGMLLRDVHTSFA